MLSLEIIERSDTFDGSHIELISGTVSHQYQYETPSKRKRKKKPKMLEIRATKGDMLAVLKFKILVVFVLILLYKTSILVDLNN
jgi:hypothetical protein